MMIQGLSQEDGFFTNFDPSVKTRDLKPELTIAIIIDGVLTFYTLDAVDGGDGLPLNNGNFANPLVIGGGTMYPREIEDNTNITDTNSSGSEVTDVVATTGPVDIVNDTDATFDRMLITAGATQTTAGDATVFISINGETKINYTSTSSTINALASGQAPYLIPKGEAFIFRITTIVDGTYSANHRVIKVKS